MKKSIMFASILSILLGCAETGVVKTVKTKYIVHGETRRYLNKKFRMIPDVAYCITAEDGTAVRITENEYNQISIGGSYRSTYWQKQ